MRDYWIGRKDEYIKTHNKLWWRKNDKWVKSKLLELGYTTILELGCGTGNHFSIYSEHHNVLAVDFIDDFIKVAKTMVPKNVDIKCKVVDATKTDFQKDLGEFGAVTTSASLQHMEQHKIDKVIREITSCCRCAILIEKTKGGESHYYWNHDYKSLFEKYGFKLYSIEQGGHPNTSRMVFTKPIDYTMTTVTYLQNTKRRNWFKECIKTVIHQEGLSFEYIIVDDGSTIKIPKNWLHHPSIRYFKREHYGRASAANFAINKAFGKYRSGVADDDLLLGADSMLLRFKMMENNPDVVLGWTNGYKVSEDGKTRIRQFRDPSKINSEELLKRGGLINGTTAIVRTDLWAKFGLNEEYTTAEEYDFQIRLAKWVEENDKIFKYFPEHYTAVNREHHGRGSSNLTDEQKRMRELIVERNS